MDYKFKIGLGYDVHQLVEGRKLILAGVQVPHTHGALGHSDADVIIHAICDALLGALALGDIGKHFADTDAQFKDIDSRILLAKVCEMIENKGWEIGNIDVSLCLEKPKISPYINQMQIELSKVMKIDINQVSIKATTAEKMGFVGRKEGLEAQAIALVYKS